MLPIEQNWGKGESSRDGSLAEDLRHRGGARTARKRRRLMTQDMRHELHTASNGTNGHVNGSSHRPQKNSFANGTNGHASPINGASPVRTNGIASSKARLRGSNFYGHDREEVTRLLIQGLEDLGYNEAAERLSQESGYQVESSTVAAFRSAVLEGKWSTAEALLFGHKSQPDGGGVSISHEEPTHNGGLGCPKTRILAR